MLKQVQHDKFLAKKKPAFTLAEMMVVLLILTVVLAASMPILTKRVRTKPLGIWRYTTEGANIYYGEENPQGAIIGSDKVPTSDGTSTGTVYPAKLYLNTGDASTNHITFASNGNVIGTMKLGSYSNIAIGNCVVPPSNSIAIGSNVRVSGLSSSIVIGNNAYTNGAAPTFGSIVSGSIAIGDNAHTTTYKIPSALFPAAGSNAVAIGTNATSAGVSPVSIGTDTVAYASSVSMGLSAKSLALHGTAIGSYANASGNHSVAIGFNASVFDSASGAAIAIGKNAMITGGAIASAIAIGENANASDTYDIAIGCNANTANTLSGDTPGLTVIGGGRIYFPAAINMIFMRAKGSTVQSDLLTLITTVSSDKRLKNVKGKFKAGLNEIRKIKTYNFVFKSDKERLPQVGVLAQDIQKIFPNAVTKDKEGYLRLRRDEIFYAMLNAIQELDEMIQDIQKRILTLENQVSAILKVENLQEKRIKNLERENISLNKKLLYQSNEIKKINIKLKKLEEK